MYTLMFLTTVVLTYYAMAVVQTVLHKLFGHRNRIRRIFRNHALGHHAKYRKDELQTDRYIDSETYVMFYYLVPASAIAVPLFALGGWVVLAGYAVGVAFAFWLHLYLHENYHLTETWLERYRWFRQKRALHFEHHLNVRSNYAIVEFWIDRLLGTRQEPGTGSPTGTRLSAAGSRVESEQGIRRAQRLIPTRRATIMGAPSGSPDPAGWRATSATRGERRGSPSYRVPDREVRGNARPVPADAECVDKRLQSEIVARPGYETDARRGAAHRT